ncbi:hypothetical protein SAMN02745116_00481 [Pilibacter termitis]|jgi:hypothetical protein|uniref:Uncharacterized protein n=1 Tax=Pilibacter termitis TaxID=263852 RepID=A0A1T4L132_9ENTE|nr:hypothetical protein [Pilibacter termitis]SJZ48442.1 hypothetical protein SAMN02745116_00481 [Pilibacter termitis]
MLESILEITVVGIIVVSVLNVFGYRKTMKEKLEAQKEKEETKKEYSKLKAREAKIEERHVKLSEKMGELQEKITHLNKQEQWVKKEKQEIKEYDIKRQQFLDNRAEHKEYMLFLLEIMNIYRANLSDALFSASQETYKEPCSFEEVETADRYILGPFDSEYYFTGISYDQISYIKEKIALLKNNISVVQFKEKLSKAELNRYHDINNMLVKFSRYGDNGEMTAVKDKNKMNSYPFYDTDKELFKFAFSELKKTQEYVNQFSEIKINLLD